MSNIYLQSFFRGAILESISSTKTTPFQLKVSALPTLTSGLLTISSNTDNEEIIEYSGVNDVTSEITVTKRGISHSCLGLTTNGVDYNNTEYQRPHTTLDSIRSDITHLHVNQVSQFSPNTDAGASVKGVSRLSVAPASPTDPISVGDNDPRLVSKYASLTRLSGTQVITNTASVVEFPTATGSADMIGTANTITIPVSGTYVVTATVRFPAPTADGNRSIVIVENGTTTIAQCIDTATTTNYLQTLEVTSAKYFTSGTSLTVKAFSTGANATLQPTSYPEQKFEAVKT